MKKMEDIIFLQFLHLGLITHRLYKMEPIFSCDVSMNEYKLSMVGMNEDKRLERSNTLPNSQLKNDDSLELILKKLHEQKIKWRLRTRNSLSWAFLLCNWWFKI
jgi:hypothetical protein